MKSFHDGKVILHGGDCMDVLRTMSADSIDAVCTDPPYHLTSIVKRFGAENAAPCKVGKTGAYARASRGFMGKQWDGGDIAFKPELWTEVLRVLKPGGHMVCFGGTRTYHRLACAIEDAGFEIRDAIMWHYGSGFPKSHDVSKGIDRAAGAKRDVVGSYNGATNVSSAGSGLRHDCYGVGGDKKSDTAVFITAPATDAARQWQGYGTALKPSTEIICLARKPLSESTIAGNVLKHGVGALNIDSCRIGHSSDDNLATSLSKNPGRSDLVTSGVYGSDRPQQRVNTSGRWPANLCHDGSPEVLAGFPEGRSAGDYPSESQETGNGTTYLPTKPQGGLYSDSGSAARFFASFPQDKTAKRFHYTSKADADDRLGSKHPTIKPVDLIQWLVRLVCPKGATILDPFAGTGTTGAAAFIEGCRAVLIEREAEYLADIERRMGMLLSGQDERARKLATPDPHDSLPLFAVMP